MMSNRTMVVAGVAVGLSVLAACNGDKRSETKPAPRPAATTPVPDTGAGDAAAARAPLTPGDFPSGGPDLAGVEAYDAPALKRLELPSGLVIEDLKIGEGEAAMPRGLLTFHYRGKVKDGAEFDVTKDHAEPKPMVEPLTRLFEGLSTGLVGVKPGGRRRLTIPGYLAPGIAGLRNEAGEVVIPSDAVLIYVVDVLEIKQQLVPNAPVVPASDGSEPVPAAPK